MTVQEMQEMFERVAKGDGSPRFPDGLPKPSNRSKPDKVERDGRLVSHYRYFYDNGFSDAMFRMFMHGIAYGSAVTRDEINAQKET